MNLAEFIAAALGIKAKRPPKPRAYVIDEGEKAVHRGQREPVAVKRSYRINRNKYDPQTCSRPKEAAKAARRAAL